VSERTERESRAASMSPMMRICNQARCGRLFAPDPSRPRLNRCEKHAGAWAARDNRMRHERARVAGRTTAHWQRVREQVLERDGYACVVCGVPARSVHIDPALRGDHRNVTPDEAWTLCPQHHGAIDGARQRQFK
jgi:5-methylcytosine-specific restriction endonuclease McrA